MASARRDGGPIWVIGSLEVPGARSPRDWLDGEWSAPEDLAQSRGLIGRVGEPPGLHAVIYDENLEIQLIGYATEGEILTAVDSLHRIGPE